MEEVTCPRCLQDFSVVSDQTATNCPKCGLLIALLPIVDIQCVNCEFAFEIDYGITDCNCPNCRTPLHIQYIGGDSVNVTMPS